MAIKLDEENKVVVYENEPEEPRSMFPNIPEASTIEGGVDDVLIDDVSIVDDSGAANIPLATADVFGATALGPGLRASGTTKKAIIDRAPTARIKGGADAYMPIVPINQHEAVFYGMAKAAGDTTQALSANEVGSYTAEAKAAIRKMLGLVEAELITDYTTGVDLSDLTVFTDLYGQPFRLRKAHILVMYPASTTGADSYIQVRCLDADSGTFYFFGSRKIDASTSCVVVYDYESFGAYFSIGNYKASSVGSSATNTVTVPYAVPSKAISALRFDRNSENDTLIPAGTRVIIYGVKE